MVRFWLGNGRSCAVVASNGRINCQRTDSYPDRDGFGWENGRSCVALQPVAIEEKYTIRLPACSDQKYDTDADGFGWENSTSCTSHNSGDGGLSVTDLVLDTGQSNALGAETAIYDPESFDENPASPLGVCMSIPKPAGVLPACGKSGI